MSKSNDKGMQKFSVSADTPITEVLKKWLTAGSMSIEGIYIPRNQCQRALVQLNRWLTEDSGASWKETAEEMQRIHSGQMQEANDLINKLAAHIPDAFAEDQEAVKEWNRIYGYN